MLARGLRWGYAGSLIAAKHPQLTRARPLSLAECMLLASPLSACACVVSGLGVPWRASLVAGRLISLMTP